MLHMNVIRVYTVLPPSFYSALVDYNSARPPAEWIWFFQGVWTPDPLEGNPDGTGNDAYEHKDIEEMYDFVDRTVRVLHGDGQVRFLREGSGMYTADASRWCLGWLLGTEWYPYTVNETNHGIGSNLPVYRGTYINATDDASPFESWLATFMDYLLVRDMDFGWQRPVSFTNWLTTDPVIHVMEPRMPVSAEDWLSVDGTCPAINHFVKVICCRRHSPPCSVGVRCGGNAGA
jgi:hypothetical protein